MTNDTEKKNMAEVTNKAIETDEEANESQEDSSLEDETEDETEEETKDDEEQAEPEPHAPPKSGGRSPIMMAMMMLAALYLMGSLKDDLLFYFVTAEPVDLGNAIDFQGTDLPNDTMVTVRGVRNPGRGISLSSSFTSHIVFPLMGSTKLLVEVKDDGQKKTMEEALALTHFTGRLVRVKDVSYYQTIRDFAAFNFGMEVPEDTLLIQAHKKPSDNWYYLVAFGALLIILAANGFLLVRRLLRR